MPINSSNSNKRPSNQSQQKIEFDINEIKTFKFKNTNRSASSSSSSSKNGKKTTSSQLSNEPIANSWDSLMNEIRSNAVNSRLRKVNDDAASGSESHAAIGSKQRKYSDSLGSNLLRDLNFILNQRSKFFRQDDDVENFSGGSWSDDDDPR